MKPIIRIVFKASKVTAAEAKPSKVIKEGISERISDEISKEISCRILSTISGSTPHRIAWCVSEETKFSKESQVKFLQKILKKYLEKFWRNRFIKLLYFWKVILEQSEDVFWKEFL